ncbi:flagellar motor stator protein MotA [Skermanella mucosa]|uniref:flagellar motor stator protein MotA n=1 Tax=Skermanella mucosa TaxID=1789672 RepID=UPI00192A7AD3|nr:flagellar motor stator protein MotA [Skermanella mucosa]UEM21591.1 flagellar motor stator protein MotA [Skermanella mucosa]
MLAIGGLVFLFICVFGVYAMTGGNMAIVMGALPHEMATIGGAAVGTFLISNSGHVIKHSLKDMAKVIKGAKFKKSDYMDILTLMFQLLKLAKNKGTVAIEPHIEKPSESPIFQAYPKITHDHFAQDLICDYLRMVSMSQDDPHQVEDIMDREIKGFLAEGDHVAHAFQGMADALPALGIVAAVLGVVKTMGSLNEPPPVLGKMIGGALVGTFLGVLLAYGIFGPIATRLKGIYEDEIKFYHVIRVIITAHLHGQAPQISVETGRKAISHEYMPSFAEVEEKLNSLPPV